MADSDEDEPSDLVSANPDSFPRCVSPRNQATDSISRSISPATLDLKQQLNNHLLKHICARCRGRQATSAGGAAFRLSTWRQRQTKRVYLETWPSNATAHFGFRSPGKTGRAVRWEAVISDVRVMYRAVDPFVFGIVAMKETGKDGK